MKPWLKIFLCHYKRRLEREIDLKRWDPELSGKLDALLILLGE